MTNLQNLTYTTLKKLSQQVKKTPKYNNISGTQAGDLLALPSSNDFGDGARQDPGRITGRGHFLEQENVMR